MTIAATRELVQRKTPRIPEKVVQSNIINLVRSIGGHPFVLGTVRPKGDSHGTRQTPGIPDVWVFLPAPALRPSAPPSSLWIEVKAVGGRMRPEQVEFKALCRRVGIAHVHGGLDDVIAFLVDGGWLSAANLPHYRHPNTQQPGAPK